MTILPKIYTHTLSSIHQGTVETQQQPSDNFIGVKCDLCTMQFVCVNAAEILICDFASLRKYCIKIIVQ